MHNYTLNPFKKQENTTLKIVAGNEITELFGNAIPYPSYHYNDKLYSNRLVYCWVIDGFFGTEKGYKYLNDIIARFKLSCDSADLHSLERKEKENQSTCKLKSFQGLKSLASERVKEKMAKYSNMHDYVFWCLKLTAEDMIKQNGLIIYSAFEDFATTNFLDKAKDKSTLRAKCRNIYNWYFERNWQIGREKKSNLSKEELMATRQEHALKNSKKIAEKTEKKVLNCITGMFAHEYKKANGSWNISLIAKDSGTSRNTVMKYLPKETLF